MMGQPSKELIEFLKVDMRCEDLGLLLLERGSDYDAEDKYPFRIVPRLLAIIYMASSKVPKTLEAIGFNTVEEIDVWLKKFEADFAERQEKERLKVVNTLIGQTNKVFGKYRAPTDVIRQLIEQKYPPKAPQDG